MSVSYIPLSATHVSQLHTSVSYTCQSATYLCQLDTSVDYTRQSGRHGAHTSEISTEITSVKSVQRSREWGSYVSEKPTDWTNAFKVEISSLADFYDVRLHGQFRVNHIHTPSFLCSPTYHHYKHPQPKSKYKAYVQFLMLEGGNVAQSRPKWKQGLTKYTKRENGIVICEKEGCSKLWEPEPRRVGDKSH